MARLTPPTRDDIPEAQRAAFDDLVKEFGGVPRYGPHSVMIHVPRVHRLMNEVNHCLRRESSLPKKVQELAMLVTAREHDCQYVWNSHAGSTRAAGVADATVDALRDRRELPPLPDDESAVVRFGQEFFRTHRVSRGTYQMVVEQFGQRGAVELGLVFGNYAMIAVLVNSFDCELPGDRKEPVLPV